MLPRGLETERARRLKCANIVQLVYFLSRCLLGI